MEDVLEAVEGSIATMIGTSFGGVVPPEVLTEPTVEAVVENKAEEEILPFSFDADFQTKIAALAVRDDDFMRSCSHLLKPEFFENAGEAALVNIALNHVSKYHCVPAPPSLKVAIKAAVQAKAIRGEVMKQVLKSYAAIFAESLHDGGFVADQVAQFAKHQAMGAALLKSVELRERGDFGKIEEMMNAALSIGINDDGEGYDYFKKIDERTEARLDKVSGKLVPQGITTGIPKMDALLYHRGWGRKELTTIMGGAKAGKTTALINFAKSASMAGKQVLYVTLEVGKGVIGDRLDACISETLMKELTSNINHIADKVEAISHRSGHLIIHEYASGTMSNKMLRSLIERYKSPGRNPDGTPREAIKFDLVVVDYADIMMPDHRTDDAIENSKSVYVGLRAIAFDENVAMLTATQTNRLGHVAAVAKAEHVAEDFNKVRTVDLMISINKTEEEAKRGEARLYFAASRNQESGFTILIRQRMDMMRFVDEVLGIE